MSEEIATEETINWEEVWKCERDICFLYYELSQYSGIMGDLAYGTIYTLPYWDFLELPLPEMHAERRKFIRSGCLVMLLAMAVHILDGSGPPEREQIEKCLQIVNRLKPENDAVAELIRGVAFALDTARNGYLSHSNYKARVKLEDLYVLVHKTFIHGYFADMLSQSESVS